MTDEKQHEQKEDEAAAEKRAEADRREQEKADRAEAKRQAAQLRDLKHSPSLERVVAGLDAVAHNLPPGTSDKVLEALAELREALAEVAHDLAPTKADVEAQEAAEAEAKEPR